MKTLQSTTVLMALFTFPVLNMASALSETEKTDLANQNPVLFSGEYEINADHRGNFALSDEDNDRQELSHQIELEFKYDISDRVTAFAETRLKYEDQWRADGDRHEKSIERGLSWLDARAGNYGIRIGRQNFDEKREWWWEEDLDAVRLYHASEKLDWELALAKELGRVSNNNPMDAEDEDIRRILGRLKWQYAEDHTLELFMLKHDDQSSLPIEDDILDADQEDESDAGLTWLGIRGQGKFKLNDLGKFDYWVDVGAVRGDEVVIDFDDLDDNRIEVDSVDKQKVRGTAFDVGLTLRPKNARGNPALTLGYAQGSADKNPDDAIDHTYRQTGLHDNDGKFEGVNSFRYYGELLRPELSNMRVLTASIGYPLRKNSSIEVLYHRYDQLEASENLNSRLRARPEGLNTHIGDEIDVVVGIEEWKNAELELIGSVFRAGKAFGEREGEHSHYVGLEFEYNF